MTHGASGMRVLVIKGKRVNYVLLSQERSKGLFLYDGFRDWAIATKAKAKISHTKIGDTLRLLASQGRECISSATSLDT